VRFLITAGPTREPIDPVRYLSNRSSGKMGYAIAEAAREAGHDVVLVSGPVCLRPPPGVNVVQVSSSNEMFDAVMQQAGECDVLVMAAAVADYKVATVSPRKIKKRDAGFALELIPTRDILAAMGKKDRNFLLVGFAAETENLEENARKKLSEKNLDLVVANNVSNAQIGMESDENEVTIFFQNGEIKKIPRAPKKKIANDLIKIFANAREKSLTKKL
jgi:phosphopantothenoylcysteine decarboxylase / phosphopantothenate---cysteine ligase